MKKKISPTIEQEIAMCKYPILMAPLFGKLLPVQVRRLTLPQIQACGNISLIETSSGKERLRSGKFNNKDIIEYSERHREILKAALVCPTYDQLMSALLSKEDNAEIEKQFKEINDLISATPRGPKRQELESERDLLKLKHHLIIPNDFSSFIVAYTLQIDESDIKNINEDTLFRAACLAVRGHDNPADHIPGQFTPFMKEDLNFQSWYVYDQKMEELKSASRS